MSGQVNTRLLILKTARERLRRGWVQDAWFSNAGDLEDGGVCAIGAIHYARAKILGAYFHPRECAEVFGPDVDWGDVVMMNDTAKNVGQVLAMFDRTIARLEQGLPVGPSGE